MVHNMTHQHSVCLEQSQGENQSTKEALTARQEAFLEVFRRLLEANGGVSPSLQEMADASGISVGSAATFVKALRLKGHLVKRGGVFRSLRLA